MAASFHAYRWISRRFGFSLLEVLTALAILSVILMVILRITSETGRAWKNSSAKIQAFQNARMAFDIVNRSLKQASLNTYYDYYDASRSRRTTTNSATFVPDIYGRYSELQFISGKKLITQPHEQVTHSIFFQTPLSYTAQTSTFGKLSGLLNTVGFYIEFNSDQADRPFFFSTLTSQSAARWRYRLVQLFQPTEQLSVYNVTDNSWFLNPVAASTPPVRLLAENIIACVVYPHLLDDTTGTGVTSTVSALTSDYEYNTRVTNWTSGSQPKTMNQLPPMVRIVLIAVDETSMLHQPASSETPPSLGFDYGTVFQSSAALSEDLKTVTDALAAQHINYRVFQSDISLNEARWSQ
jgi:uncharacterized protein (TIGR02599 family)